MQAQPIALQWSEINHHLQRDYCGVNSKKPSNNILILYDSAIDTATLVILYIL